MNLFAALVVLVLFRAAVRGLAAWLGRDELERPVPTLRPAPRRRSRFAGEVLGGRR